MKKLITICLVAWLSLTLAVSASASPTIFLDADTPATGSNLDTSALVTAYGTISIFDGEIRDRDADPEFNAAGASGDVFDIFNDNTPVTLSFDFDVISATFIYGGNTGDILIEARDASNALVDSYYQANTSGGQPAGPITLSGSGIRSLSWQDQVSGMHFAALDNIELCVIPAPGAILLGSIGIGLVGWLRRRRAL